MRQVMLCAAALAAALLALPASAAVLHVPADHATIQAAITSARNGDEVVVAPGTYAEALDLEGKHITVRSSGGAAVTILDGATVDDSLISAFSGEGAGGTIVRGFTFRNGRGTEVVACNQGGRKGGAVFVLSAGISIVDCVFENNGVLDEVSGGAIFACHADVEVLTSRFDRNLASFGGAINYVGLPARRLIVEHTTFRDNEAGQGGAIAGALFSNSSVTVRHSEFDGNRSGHGGGIAVSARHSGRVAIEHSTFTDNFGRGTGGGVKVNLVETATFTMTGSRFDDNRSSHGAGLNVSAGDDGRASIAECTFTGGVASFGGGAALFARDTSSIELLRSDFRGHEAGFGGGIFAAASGEESGSGGATIRIDGARVLDNLSHACCDTGIYYDSCFVDGRTPEGSGLYYGGGADLRTVFGGTITVANSLFARNSATGGGGGGVHAGSCAGGTIDFINTTIAGNTGTGLHTRFAGPRVPGPEGHGQVRVANSIVRGNEGQIVVEKLDPLGTTSVAFSNIEGGFAGERNLDADPLFTDPASDDYRLTDGSSCIDAGDNTALGTTLAHDAAGRPRLIDDLGTPDTGRGERPVVDLGAFEYQPGRRRVVRR